MARERIIEGAWACTSCGSRGIKARHKACPGCSNPRESTGSESEFDFSGGETVIEAPVLAIAGAGPDWFCSHCSIANRGDTTQCRGCSAEREAAPAAADVAPVPLAAPMRSRWQFGRAFKLGCLAPLALAVTSFCGYITWAIQRQDVEATVASVAWSRTVRRETFTRHQRKRWKDELREKPAVMPVNGVGEDSGVEDIRSCEKKQRDTREVAIGTERVCSTKSRSVACGSQERCSTQDMGNGFRKEVCHDETKYCSESYQDCTDRTKYRTEPVYGEECTFDTWDWKEADARTLSGTLEDPRWPDDLDVGALDRLVRIESYDLELTFQHRGDPAAAKHHPRSVEEFMRYRPGTSATLVVGNDGTVDGFREGDKVRPLEP